MPHHVFISHSSKDKAAADAVCAALETRHLVCWIAPRNVRPGKTYAAELIQAINDAQVMVLLHSKSSNDSPEVHREVERAGAKRIAIISLRLEACELSHDLEYFLSSVQWIDATKPPLKDHLSALCDAVQALVSQCGSPPSPESSAPQAAPPAHRAGARSRTAAAAIALVLALGGTAAWRLIRTPPATSDRPATSASTPVHGIPVTGRPPPKTSNAEAAAAFASGLQNMRDASMALAWKDFRHAVSLDPSLAAANLQLSLAPRKGGVPSGARAAFVAATQFRASLDERDTALLAYADAYTTEPFDPTQAVERIRKIADRFPDDALVAFYQATALLYANRFAEARVATKRAIELDPQFAGVLWLEAGTYWYEDDLDGAAEPWHRCLEISPMAASCLRSSISIREYSGQCAEMETDARRLVSIEPSGAFAHWWMGRALAARGKPVESVRAALDEATALGGVSEGIFPAQAVEDAVFAMLTGDLAGSEQAARKLEKGIGQTATEKDHGQVAAWLMSIAEERGDFPQEVRLAEEFEKHAPAWRANDPEGVRLWRLYLLHETGRLQDGPFNDQREVLYREGSARVPAGTSAVQVAATRFSFFARYANTRAEAVDALAHMGSGRPGLRGLETLPLGRVYLLAGQVDAAIPLLRQAAGSCAILSTSQEPVTPNTITFLHANLLLGQALEQKGDKTGACEAYARIVARWAHPTPRSITAEAAHAAMKRLHCDG